MLHYNTAAFIANYIRWTVSNEGPYILSVSDGVLWDLDLFPPKHQKRIVIYVGEQMSDFVRRQLEELPEETDIIIMVSSGYEFGKGLGPDDKLINAVVHGCTEETLSYFDFSSRSSFSNLMSQYRINENN